MSGAQKPLAFPNPAKGPYGTDGMTLRDWFAGQALIGLATMNHGNDWGINGKGHAPACAEKAYRIADAMLAARTKETDQ